MGFVSDRLLTEMRQALGFEESAEDLTEGLGRNMCPDLVEHR